MAIILQQKDFAFNNWPYLYLLFERCNKQGLEVFSELPPDPLFVKYVNARPFIKLAIDVTEHEGKSIYRLELISYASNAYHSFSARDYV